MRNASEQLKDGLEGIVIVASGDVPHGGSLKREGSLKKERDREKEKEKYAEGGGGSTLKGAKAVSSSGSTSDSEADIDDMLPIPMIARPGEAIGIITIEDVIEELMQVGAVLVPSLT